MTQNSPHANSIPEEWLSAYLDNELSSEQRQLVEAAVKEQPQLAQLLDELIATRRLIQQLPAFPTSSSRRSPSNTKSEVSDLDDGLDSPDDSSNGNNLASASDRQLQQRLADDRPTVDLARSNKSGYSTRLSWRMLTLAASLLGVAALGATLWYQSDRWNKLAFDTSTDNRVGSSIPDSLVDEDSGPKAFSSAENQVAPMAAPASDALGVQRAATEGGMGGGRGGREAAGGLSGGGLSGGGLGGSVIGGSSGLGGENEASAGAATHENTLPNQSFDFEPRKNDQQLSQKEAFNQLHDDAASFNAPKMPAGLPENGLAGVVSSDLLGDQFSPGGGNQLGTPTPSPAASVPTDPINQAPLVDPSPAASPKILLEHPLNSGQSVETLPPPSDLNERTRRGMKAKDGSRESMDSGRVESSQVESSPAGKAEPMRGLDAADSSLTAPSMAPSAAPSTAPLSEAQSSGATKNEASKKSVQPKSQEKNQVLISKSALYRSPAWSEAAVTAQLEGNPLYRPMLSLLSDTNQDKSLKVQVDAKANQADESVLTAVVRLTANQRAAVIEQSKQLGVEPAIKDDSQTAWVLFLSATELDRLLESANQQEKLSIFWISPAKQSATSDRRVLIVNPF